MTKGRKRLIIVFSVGVALFVIIILHIMINVNPIIEQVSEHEVQALATIAVNSACDDILSEYLTTDIINYVMDGDGNLQMVTTNTAVMNAISRKAIDASQAKIATMGQQGVPIPLGSLSGITFLSGQGPNVYIKVFPIGAVNANFTSEFIASGINQTRHKILLNVYADIRVVMPGANNVVRTETQILLCENLIIGKVPDAYFQMQNLSDLLDLVP